MCTNVSEDHATCICTLKMEVICLCETVVTTGQTTRCHEIGDYFVMWLEPTTAPCHVVESSVQRVRIWHIENILFAAYKIHREICDTSIEFASV